MAATRSTSRFGVFAAVGAGRRRRVARRRPRTAGRVQRGRPARRRWLAPALALAAIASGLLLFVAVRTFWSPRPHDRHLTMAQARAVNAAIPFVDGPLIAARPFVFHGTPAARLQAADCLATVALYEAGDDAEGQKAVIQVVLNRVGRLGFAPTVCGVVYQGATLKTGCQFSFTCDNSAHRRPERRGWASARTLARRALAGGVDRDVGTATHYHADWMVPYWIDSLDKIAQVRGHIFYRRKKPAAASPW